MSSKLVAIQAAILLEALPNVVAERIRSRDGLEIAAADIEKFAEAERIHAETICNSLGVALVKLDASSLDALLEAIRPYSQI